MKKILIPSLVLLTISFSPLQAEEISFVEKMRPKLVRFLGEPLTNKLIGIEKVQAVSLVMPKLPEIVEDATSTAVYYKKEETIKINPEQEQKLNMAFIYEIYDATRRTKPNTDEVGKFMNVLSQGGTREGIYRALVLDSVYGGMENWDHPVKRNAAEFAVKFYETYLGKKVSLKTFEGMSIFSLKRLITERALDMVDAFGENKREDLNTWYAIMSEDLATSFPQVFTNAIRKNKSAVDHKSWAAAVPLQHIKSEIMIKLHQSLNSMI